MLLRGQAGLAVKSGRASAPIPAPHARIINRRAYRLPRSLPVGGLGLDVASLAPVHTALASASTLDPGTPFDATALTYAGLGLAALSFGATFGLAPRFRSLLKEPVDWRDMHPTLLASSLGAVTPSEAAERSAAGSAVIVDVRLEKKFTEYSAAGSISLPLYQPIQQWDLASNVRRLGFAFFGIFGTELALPSFLAAAAEAVPRNRQVLLLCQSGGSVEPKIGATTGFQSQSLKAAYWLLQNGWTDVAIIKGGIRQWERDDLPTQEGAAAGQEQQLLQQSRG